MDSVHDGEVRDAILDKFGEQKLTTSCYVVMRVEGGFYGPNIGNTSKVFLQSGEAHKDAEELNQWMKNNNLHQESIRLAMSGGAWMPFGFGISCGAMPLEAHVATARMNSPFSGMITYATELSSGWALGLYDDVSGELKKLPHLFRVVSSGEAGPMGSGLYKLKCPDPDYRFCSRGVNYEVKVLELRI